jgi:hypothetical protein
MEALDIVKLIESNPITRFTNTYNVKLLDKMKSNFTEFEQQLFITSFYCYLNYNKITDFVIDLDNIWKWLGFSQKVSAIRVLEQNFVIDMDYKMFALHFSKAEETIKTPGKGGHNKSIIMMTIKCFKTLCLKAHTKKSTQIHEYYIKMEEIVQEVVDEESAELRLQITEQEKQIVDKNKQLENVNKDKSVLREKTLLEQFPDNIQCVYYGLIDNLSSKKEALIKFGCSNFLSNRIKCHRTTYANFRLVGAYRVCNKTQVENAIKKHPILVLRQRKLKINNITHTELLASSDIDIDEIIKDIIKNIEYTPENYSKLLLENDTLKLQLNKFIPEKYSQIIVDYAKLQQEYLILQEKYDTDIKMKNKVFTKLVGEKNVLYNRIISDIPDETDKKVVVKKMKRGIKQKDGLYYFDEGVFSQLYGTRQEVWDEVAYKTSGGLIKYDLTIGSEGNIVSKIKALTAAADNRLIIYMTKIGKVNPQS